MGEPPKSRKKHKTFFFVRATVYLEKGKKQAKTTPVVQRVAGRQSYGTPRRYNSLEGEKGERTALKKDLKTRTPYESS